MRQSLKDTKGFSKGLLSEDAIIAMFLNNVRKALRVHTIIIQRAKPTWEDFLKEITWMDNEQPREGVVVRAPFKSLCWPWRWRTQES